MMPAADTPSSPVSPRHRRSRLRRLLRFVLFSFLALLFLLFSAVLVLRLLYPPARIKAMINEAAIEKLDRRLSLRKVWLHPLRGFILEEVSLSPYPDSTSGYDLFVLRQFHARQIAVRYSLRDIFNNKLHLREVEIVGPEMEFFVDMLDTTLIDFAALARTELPLTLDLRSLRLRDSRIRVVLADTLTRQEFFIGDLDAVLKDVRLPGGGFLRNDSALQADLAIRCQATPLSLSQSDLRSGSTLRLEALLDLDTRLLLRSYHDLRLALGLQLRELVYEEEAPGSVRRTAFRPRLNLALGLHGDGHIGSAHLDSLILALDGRRWLVAEGAAEGLYGQGRFSARLSHGEIPLDQALSLAQELLPPGRFPDLQWLEEEAALHFSGAEIAGSLDEGFEYQLPLELRHAGLSLNGDSLRLRGLGASFDLRGRLLPGGAERTALTAALICDGLRLLQPGSTPLTAGAGSATADMVLNRLMLPEKAHIALRLDDLMGLKAEGECDLSAPASLQDLSGGGTVSLTGFDLGRFPALAASGKAGALFSFHLDGLDRIAAALEVKSTPLILLIDEEPVHLDELELEMKLQAGTDTSLAVIRIDSLGLALNRMVEAAARAEILNRGDRQIRFNFDRLAIRHDAIWAWLPELLREPFAEADLTGTTTFMGGGRIGFYPSGLRYDVDVRMTTAGTSFRAPAQFTLVNGLGIDARLTAANGDGIHALVEAGLDSLRVGKAGGVAFHHNQLSLQLASKDLSSLIEAKGRLELPDLFTSGSFEASIAELKRAMRIKARFALNQSIADTLRLPQGIRMRGDSDLLVTVEADTALARVAADISTRGVSFFMPDNVYIRDVLTDLHLRQEVDLVNKRLLASPAFRIATPSNAFMDYMAYRQYYHERLPGFSRLRIGRVDLKEYAVEDIDLELYAGEGRLEVPALVARLYGGNLGGRMVLDLAGGNLKKAAYGINLTFANVNSDLLLPKGTRDGKYGIINGNMDFQGIGLDPAAGIRLEGQAYITEIGPKVADNLLRSLDPQGVDSSIRTTRLLINRGFKPKLMTFVLRHGYLYPEIIFAQPWYFPMRLSGGKVELARIPLDMFLRSSGQGPAAR